MAMMVHRNCLGGCCPPPDRGTARQRERRELSRWTDEYDDPADVEQRACSKGGPDCGCNRPLRAALFAKILKDQESLWQLRDDPLNKPLG